MLRHLFPLEYPESSQIAGYGSALVHFVHLAFNVSELTCPSSLPALLAGDAGAQLEQLGCPESQPVKAPSAGTYLHCR